MQLTERQLNNSSNVRVSFLTGGLPSRHWQNYEELLIVQFYSESPVDWRDMLFMSAMLAAGIRAWQPNAVILDLRKLYYTGGDSMASVVRECEDPNLGRDVALAVILSDICRPAMVSLFQRETKTSSEVVLCESLEEAVSAIDRALSK